MFAGGRSHFVSRNAVSIPYNFGDIRSRGDGEGGLFTGDHKDLPYIAWWDSSVGAIHESPVAWTEQGDGFKEILRHHIRDFSG